MKARIPNQGQSQAQMLKKLQEMQAQMEAAQAQVEESEFTSSSGGGAVEVAVSGRHEIRSIKIKPEVVDPEDVEMLEDMLMAALNEAMRKADDTMEREMSRYKDGLGIPGLM